MRMDMHHNIHIRIHHLPFSLVSTISGPRIMHTDATYPLDVDNSNINKHAQKSFLNTVGSLFDPPILLKSSRGIKMALAKAA